MSEHSDRRRRSAMTGRGLAVTAVLALIGAACTGGGSETKGSTYVISLSDFTIAAPDVIPADRPFSLDARNVGKVPHTLAIEVDGTKRETRILNPTEAAALPVSGLPAGEYTLFCSVPGHRAMGMETTLTVGAESGAKRGLRPEEIDAAHEAGVKAFPAKTEGVGGLVLKPTIVDGRSSFDVTAGSVRWEVSPGDFVDAYAYNGQIPGPEIRVRQGDEITVVLRNELPESTTLHFHGVTVPNAMDGVPFITQPPVKTGESFTYAFTVRDGPGTYMYHSHHNADHQIGKGLLGAFIVEPTKTAWDIERTMVVGDGALGYTLNGKGFPATAPIVAKRGQRVLLRYLNEGQQIHPMHLHGFPATVIARDGRPITPYVVDTLSVAPGERYDVVFTASLRGIWAFHCHILSHAESEHGMHGMVTAVIVE
jgi:manganese oxidase